ncbi:MAG: FHA domain-containing protein, partial [Myxococcales bacterium]
MPRAESAEGGDTVSMVPAGVSLALASTIRVRVTEGPDAGLGRESRTGRLVVGTHPSADLVLTDRSISRFHCELTLEEGVLTVRDLGSRNGTTVDAVRVLHAPVGASNRIGLGVSRLQVDPGAAPGPVSISPRERFGTLVGCSVAMRRVFEQLERAAVGRATVLLEGEPGTGKEAAAEAIHLARHKGPFVALDIGAIAPEQIESELFGHEKDSFPGATRERRGA